MKQRQDVGQRRGQVLGRLFTPAGELRADLPLAPALSSADVAALFQMSERAVRMWVAKRSFPHTRSLGGGKLLYPADKVAQLYLERHVTASAQRTSPPQARQECQE